VYAHSVKHLEGSHQMLHALAAHSSPAYRSIPLKEGSAVTPAAVLSELVLATNREKQTGCAAQPNITSVANCCNGSHYIRASLLEVPHFQLCST
jgi:hypothetical protein